MSDIPLRKYLEEIDGLIDKQQIDEAIAHCRHILAYYPKHIDTYRLLGKALLEKGRHGDAADIFQRVLSSVPDDFVSHVGMSIVREDEANLEAALWHMERAFEANPANGPIQEELRRLYARRDGVAPPKARLTRGALARMYARGALYPQAEAELKAALAADPERVDLATVLAQIYYQAEQRAEAAEVCNTILQKLPYSQEANRIIAALLMAQGRTNDAVPYRQRLEALDPYAAFVDPSANGHGTMIVDPDAVKVTTLDYLPSLEGAAGGSPDWMQSLGEKFETPAASPSDSAPDWLRGPRMEESPGPSAPAEIPVAAADLPDWMRELQPEAAAPAQAAPGPEWLTDLAAAPAASEEMPDWLKKATGPLSPASLPEALQAGTPEAALPAEPAQSEMPDWLKAATGQLNKPQPQPPIESAESESDVPDWLKPATGPLSEKELPEWMRGAAPEVPTPATAPLPAPPAVGAPDWLKAPSGSPAPAELPDWMKGAAPEPPMPSAPPADEAAYPAAAPAAEDEIPEWLKAAAPAEALGEAAPAEEIPDWLKAATETPSAFVAAPEVAEADLSAMSDDDALRWMEGLAAQQVENPLQGSAKPEELITQAAPAESAPAAVAPEEEAPALEPTPLDELPAWMRDMAPPAPESSEAEAIGTAPLSPDSLPEWMRAAAPGADALADRRVQLPVEEEAEPVPLDQLPAWMRRAAAPPPAPAESAPEVELPEWMKAAEPEAAEPAAPLAADEKPDWLKQMEAEADQYEAAAGQPAQPTPEIELPEWMKAAEPEAAEPAAAPIAADEKPDWLKQMEAEADQYEAAAGQPAQPALEIELPEWMKAAEPEAAEPAAAPLAADEKPDWLKQMEAEADQYEAAAGQPAPAPAEPPKPRISADELPSFLQMASEEAIARANEPTHLADEMEGEKENWLAEVMTQSQAEAEPAEAVSADLPDWVKAMAPPETVAPPEAPALPPAAAVEIPPAPAQPEATPDLSTMSDDDALRWLEGLAAQQGARPEELVTRRAAAPEWLRPPEAETPAEEPPQALTPDSTILLDDQKVPEWLRKPGEPAPMPPAEWLRAPVEEEPAAPEATPAAETATPDLSTMSDDDALRWLEGLAAQQGARPEELVTRRAEGAARPPAIPLGEAAPEADLPGFLRKREFAEPEAVSEAPSISAEEPALGEGEGPAPTAAEEMPDWLKAIDIPAPAEAAPTPEAAAPAETPSAAMPDLGAMSAEEALRWMETLAAQQGAKPEELVTRRAESMAQPEIEAYTPEPEIMRAEAAEAAPISAEEAPLGEGMPGWLRQMEAPAAPEPETPAPVAEAAPPAVSAEPDLASMSAEEALRWMETLAARQGARPEELVTKPEERLAEPPAWAAVQPAEPEAPAAPEPAPMPGAATLPPSLAAALEEEAPAAPEPETPAPVAEAAPPAVSAEPDLASMSAEDALRWLETLAAQQGASPETLVTKPEERLTQPPTWVTAQPVEPETPAAPEPAPTPGAATLPPSLAAALEEEAPAAPEAPAQPAPAEPAPAPAPPTEEKPKLSRLAERLAASRRAKDADIARRFEEQRAQQAAARLEVQRKMEEKRSPRLRGTGPLSAPGTGQLGTGPLPPKPATGPLPAKPATGPLPAKPATGPLPPRPVTGPLGGAPEAPEAQPAELAQPGEVSRTPRPRPRRSRPVRPRGRLARSPFASQAPENVLALARQFAADGDYENAAEAFGYLVATGQFVDEVITGLERDAAGRRLDPSLLRVLGDGYMKINRLQRALDAYRQALGQL